MDHHCPGEGQGTSNVDQRMLDWATTTLANWDVDPTPANVDYLLGTALAARARGRVLAGSIAKPFAWMLRRRIDELERTMARRRDRTLRRNGWIK